LGPAAQDATRSIRSGGPKKIRLVAIGIFSPIGAGRVRPRSGSVRPRSRFCVAMIRRMTGPADADQPDLTAVESTTPPSWWSPGSARRRVRAAWSDASKHALHRDRKPISIPPLTVPVRAVRVVARNGDANAAVRCPHIQPCARHRCAAELARHATVDGLSANITSRQSEDRRSPSRAPCARRFHRRICPVAGRQGQIGMLPAPDLVAHRP